MAGKKREVIMLESTAGTGYRIYTEKNRSNDPEKMEMKKYDPKVRKVVIFKEKKLPSHS